MKKLYVFALFCIPLCLILLFMAPQLTEGVQEAQQQAPRPEYHRETDHISMMEVGKILEQFGKQIQQNKSVTIDGNSFPVTGNGRVEFHVMPARRGQGTSISFEISSGQTGPPTRGNTYVAYLRGAMRGAPSEFAGLVAKLGKSLANTGAFVMEDHSVALKGTVSVVQRVMERTHASRGQRPPYSFYIDVVFGVPMFPVPADEQDFVEEEQRGWIKELVIKETTGVDQKAVAKLLDSLSSDLKVGKVKVGDKTFEIGKNIFFQISHLVTKDGKGNRIRVGFMFGDVPPRARPTGPRYSKEFFDEPMKKVGALLKRWGTEILESGGFKLGENEFKVKEMANYEIHASSRGFSIELQYTEPPKKK
ncbi:MAG: hypothetical protein JSV96_18085 [Candidatus Aminicenantes bacterium]|nr:MAG: hypothetical protein JSV96_18085 [Candidatus Aminicenantes bacterium]